MSLKKSLEVSVVEEAEDSEAAVLVRFYKIEMTGKQPIPPVPEKW